MNRKSTFKDNVHQSNVYPDLLIAQNYLEQFVSEVPPNFDIQTLHPKDQKNIKYTNFMKKLFKQLPITKQTLWICTLKSTPGIHVYFSQPEYYPISKCCNKAICVQFSWDNSGQISCTNCQKKIVDFVYSEFYDDQKENGTIFLQKKKSMDFTKNLIKKNLINDAFKVRNLQNNFLKPKKNCDINENLRKGGFIVEMAEKLPTENISDHFESFFQSQQLPQNLRQTKKILEDLFA